MEKKENLISENNMDSITNNANIAQGVEFLENDLKYNHYTETHIVLYSINENSEIVLLLKSLKEGNLYSEISTNISDMDTAPTIAACRVMTSIYHGLFTEENMKKVLNKELLTLDDLDGNIFNKSRSNDNFFSEIPFYHLRKTKSFVKWIKKMEDNPIQFDLIKGKQIYFIEVPLLDSGFFNQNLKQLNYPYEFKYFSKEEMNKSNLDPSTRLLLNSFDFVSHIKKTREAKANDAHSYYVMLSCWPQTDKVVDDSGCFILFSLFTGLYRRNNERWFYYSASKGQLPDEEILKSTKCKGIVFPGSACHVYNREPHTLNVMDFLKKISTESEFSHLKYLGICFGHQIFSEANGGRVVEREQGNAFYVEEIYFEDEFWELDFVKKSGLKKEKHSALKVLELHKDDVDKIPRGMKNYAYSKSCKHEIFVSDDKKVMTLQGHPEYTPQVYFFRIVKTYQDSFNSEEELEAAYTAYLEEHMKNGQYDFEFRDLCFTFLKC